MTLALSSAQAGPLGLLIVLLLVVASYFLFRSLNTQLKKVPKSFDPPEDDQPAEPEPRGAVEDPAGQGTPDPPQPGQS